MKTILITIFCLLGGPFFSWKSASTIITATRANSWPTVQGMVKSSTVDQSQSSRRRMTYKPKVIYEFVVGDVLYTADQVDFGDRGTSSIQDAIDTAGLYRPGEEVKVHYNAQDPSIAVLRTGSVGTNWLGLVFGLGMTVFGFFLARDQWRRLNDDNYSTGSGF